VSRSRSGAVSRRVATTLATAIALAIVPAVTTVALTAQAHGEACTSMQGEDTCPQGEACTVQDGAAGVCAAPPCASDLECVAPLLRCDTTRVPAVCIQCTSDSECAAPKTCDLDPRSTFSNLCVECAPGGSTCASSAAGHRCLFSKGICGCAKDEDCAIGSACGPRSICELSSRATTDAGHADGGADGHDAGDTRARLDGASSTSDDLLAGGGCAQARRARPTGSGSPLVDPVDPVDPVDAVDLARGWVAVLIALGAVAFAQRRRARAR
jgi:hypothetical protein